jgi:hypothetical protein
MPQEIPSPADVRQRLEQLSWAEVQTLCHKCGAPFTTVWKIRGGETTDPRLETVRAIWPELQRVPDPSWPHPQGRPCIDVAAPATESIEASHAA